MIARGCNRYEFSTSSRDRIYKSKIISNFELSLIFQVRNFKIYQLRLCFIYARWSKDSPSNFDVILCVRGSFPFSLPAVSMSRRFHLIIICHSFHHQRLPHSNAYMREDVARDMRDENSDVKTRNELENKGRERERARRNFRGGNETFFMWTKRWKCS